ncbi:hypothetical protein [Pseudobdellovibrio sp. HCB154]|uniref:hypothetical protein n=1 Tax=Pseudobdellovibrio sp. HCB154 TaxID=3386277 RepID=UPI003916E5F0
MNFAKKHYFFIGSIWGLCMALVVGYWAMNKSLWSMMFSFDKYNGFVPIFCGSMTILSMAKMFDKKIKNESYWLRGLILPVVIFMTGSAIGCLFNIMNYSAEYTFASQFYDYVVKPMYWLTALGLPAAAILGTGLFMVVYSKAGPLRV